MGAVIHPSPDPVRDFESVYRRCFPFVWRSVVRLGLPALELDDAVQEVFVVAYRKRRDYDGRASLEAWLYGITRRVVLNQRRRRARRARLWHTHAPRGQAGVDGVASVERAEASALLQTFLDGLTPAKREAFILGELEQMTGREMGAALGVSPNTASARLRSARLAFTEYCGQLRPDTPKLDPDDDTPNEHAQRHHWSLLVAAVPQLRPTTSVATSTPVAAARAGRLAVASTGRAGWWLGLQSFTATVVVGAGAVALLGAASQGSTPPDRAPSSAEAASAEPPRIASAGAMAANQPEPVRPATPPSETAVPSPPSDDVAARSRARAAPTAEGHHLGRRPRPHRERAHARPTDTLAAETTLLAEIRGAQSRGAHRAALELAEIHAERFGEGQLGLARRRAEVVSLCALGRTAKARRAHTRLTRLDPQASLPPTCDPDGGTR